MTRAAMALFAAETRMARLSRTPTLLLRKKTRRKSWTQEERERDSASPPWSRGPIKARLNARFATMAQAATRTGVRVSCRA